jgi:hypothetical protein
MYIIFKKILYVRVVAEERGIILGKFIERSFILGKGANGFWCVQVGHNNTPRSPGCAFEYMQNLGIHLLRLCIFLNIRI